MAALFPEVPSRDFQAVDTTLDSTDAASRPFSGHSERVVNAANLKKALSESFLVSAADCLHACHAHLTDPENFWKSINDACVIRCAACTECALTSMAPPHHVAGMQPQAGSKVSCPSWVTVLAGSTYSTRCTAMAFTGLTWAKETKGWLRKC